MKNCGCFKKLAKNNKTGLCKKCFKKSMEYWRARRLLYSNKAYLRLKEIALSL